MKKLITLILTLFTIFTTAHATDEISVYIEGQKVEFDQPPVIIDGRTLVPMRALFEALGANVSWEEETKTVFGTSLGISVYVTIDENVMFRNTCEIDLDVPAKIINGRTMIPLRVVSEAFGMQVIWDNQSRTINLSSLGNIKELYWNDDYVYYGETLDGKAYGYGILYKLPNYEVASMGLFNSFESNYMIKGSTWFDGGSYYNGEYSGYMFNGLGTYIFPDGETQVGEWKDGKLNGEAVCYYTNGDKYIGMFVNDEKCGQGTYYYSSGDKYVGEFKDGNKNGQGTYYYSSGDKYVGEHKDGTMHGQGTYYFANGRTLTGQWYDGEYITTTQQYIQAPSEQASSDVCMTAFCNEPRVNNSSYCFDHKCRISGCIYGILSNDEYCMLHKCSETFCQNRGSDGSRYCYEHNCTVSGCESERKNNSQYCYSHKCTNYNCVNKRSGYSSYCTEHKCLKSNCTYSRALNSKYCYLHKDY